MKRYEVHLNEYNRFSRDFKETVLFETDDRKEASRMEQMFRKLYKCNGYTSDTFTIENKAVQA